MIVANYPFDGRLHLSSQSISRAFILVWLTSLAVQSTLAAETTDPYDALYEAMMPRQREDGKLKVDDPATPLLFIDSRFLKMGDSQRKFSQALDAFNGLSQKKIESYSEIKRALMQRHLWAVFDHMAYPDFTPYFRNEPNEQKRDRVAFQPKLAALIRRLALTRAEILGLPNTLAATTAAARYPREYSREDRFQPFLPDDLFDDEGPWVCLRKTYHKIPAQVHSEHKSGRSVFLILMRLPGDRQETLGYLKTLADFRKQWVTEPVTTTPSAGIHYVDIYANPDTPQFPIGTQFALVDQALLISDEGELVPSPLIYSIQLRAVLTMDFKEFPKPRQSVAQFIMQPRQLMKSNAVMKALGRDEHHVSIILSGADPFENPAKRFGPRLQSCKVCHGGTGIHSMVSRLEGFQRRSLLPPRFLESTRESVAEATAWEKKAHYSWGLLKGLWQAEAR